MSVRLKTDRWLFWITLAMLFFGLVMVYSATSVKYSIGEKPIPPWMFPVKQAAAVFIGFVLLMFLKRRNYTEMQSPHWAFAPFGIVLALQAIAYFADGETHRWLRVGPLMSIQPSEFGKPALALFLAWLVVRHGQQVNEWQTLKPFLLMIVALAGLVIKGDLGTAMVLTGTAAAVMFVAGLNRRYCIALGVMAVIVLVAGVMSRDYRRDRVIRYIAAKAAAFQHLDPTGTLAKIKPPKQTDGNHHGNQSVITLGNGGVLGVGVMNGHQNLNFLPEAHTDYIFAHIGEEMGLVACLALMAAFLIILWRGLRLFWIASDPFGQYLALAVTVSIVFQALFNMTVVMDLIPSKGLTLPLISFGGSSMMSTLASLGILMSVSEHAG